MMGFSFFSTPFFARWFAANICSFCPFAQCCRKVRAGSLLHLRHMPCGLRSEDKTPLAELLSKDKAPFQGLEQITKCTKGHCGFHRMTLPGFITANSALPDSFRLHFVEHRLSLDFTWHCFDISLSFHYFSIISLQFLVRAASEAWQCWVVSPGALPGRSTSDAMCKRVVWCCASWLGSLRCAMTILWLLWSYWWILNINEY